MENDEKIELGKRLKSAREYRGFSQEEIAKLLGVPRTAVLQVEKGQRKLDALELKKISQLYGCSIDELTGTGELKYESSFTDRVNMVARAAAALSSTDQKEVLRFAEFLKSRKKSESK